LLPLLNAMTTHTHLGVTLLRGDGPWAVAGFDLFSLGLGLALLYAASKLTRRQLAVRTGAGKKKSANEPSTLHQTT
jgi:hypothetical protein